MSFIESIKYLASRDFPDDGLNPTQPKLRLAAKAFLGCDEKLAEALAREVYNECTEPEIKGLAVSILFALLLWQDRFEELAYYGLPRDEDDAEQITVYNIKAADFLLSAEPSIVDMPEFPLIQPIMAVELNGTYVDLLIDTGALITVITDSVAELCGVLSDGKGVMAGGVTGASTEAKMARIGELKIGNSVFTNKLCIVIPDAAIDYSAIGKPKMNGAIGWEIIQRLRWEIDYKNRKIRIEAPRRSDAVPNMCCDFQPMVRVTPKGEETIVVSLDTGADSSIFGKSVIGRFSGAKEDKQEYGGAGQTVKIESAGYTVPQLCLNIGGAEIELKDTFIHSEREYNFARTFILPGNLGSDIAEGKTLIIDYENRYLEVVNLYTH